MSEIQEAKWYVVHTYSGHENKVKATIENSVKNRGMEDYIKQVIVPTEDVIETTKTGKEKVRQRKIYPSYVLQKERHDESRVFLFVFNPLMWVPVIMTHPGYHVLGQKL